MTSYLSSQGPLQELTLKPLILKTVMLCSLVCAQREQTLCLLDLNNKVIVQDAITFILSDRHKTARPCKTLKIFFPTFPGNVNLCPVSTLQEYVKRTESLRHLNGQYSFKVFISYVKLQRNHNWNFSKVDERSVKTFWYRCYFIQSSYCDKCVHVGFIFKRS